jgi:hypothetical protein
MELSDVFHINIEMTVVDVVDTEDGMKVSVLLSDSDWDDEDMGPRLQLDVIFPLGISDLNVVDGIKSQLFEYISSGSYLEYLEKFVVRSTGEHLEVCKDGDEGN